MRGKYMATETANAMDVFGLGNFASGVLDEIELDRQLQKGIEQIERGETLTLQEFEKQMNEKVANGFYTHQHKQGNGV
jgi:hypothetical protein